MFATPSTSGLNIDQVYEPAEDSFLFLDLLQEEVPFLQGRYEASVPLVLELGIGSGIVTTFFHNSILTNAMFLGSDVNPYACKAAKDTSKQNGSTQYFDVLRTDLWDGLRSGIVDVLLFNPPYVPNEIMPDYEESVKRDDWLDFALLGGADGMEITSIVLDRLGEILNPDGGIAYILFCRRNKPNEVARIMRDRGWTATLIGERTAGWEILSIYRFTRP
ncbi:S-adenosyl-L-methionine-dependent methyltransferase [Lipomyces arxii]|uniref:S-adenosyl-L-methionine-dependent methyltransferase n=1 Tax=Lipomyces arxii TaxID=56418 RepID=UPI0034D00C91